MGGGKTSELTNDAGFVSNATSAGNVDRFGNMRFLRVSGLNGGAMSKNTYKTLYTVNSADAPNIAINYGFAIGYENNGPVRYGLVNIKTNGEVQVSPNEAVQSGCYWLIIAIWRMA